MSALVKRVIACLSSFIFETLLKRESAQAKVAQIKRDNEVWNSTIKHGCNACRGKLVSAISGSEGLLTSPHKFYRCTSCGNEQEEDSDYSRHWDFEEIEKAGLVEYEDGKYRYRLLSSYSWFLLFMLVLGASFFLPLGFHFWR